MPNQSSCQPIALIFNFYFFLGTPRLSSLSTPPPLKLYFPIMIFPRSVSRFFLYGLSLPFCFPLRLPFPTLPPYPLIPKGPLPDPFPSISFRVAFFAFSFSLSPPTPFRLPHLAKQLKHISPRPFLPLSFSSLVLLPLKTLKQFPRVFSFPFFSFPKCCFVTVLPSAPKLLHLQHPGRRPFPPPFFAPQPPDNASFFPSPMILPFLSEPFSNPLPGSLLWRPQSLVSPSLSSPPLPGRIPLQVPPLPQRFLPFRLLTPVFFVSCLFCCPVTNPPFLQKAKRRQACGFSALYPTKLFPWVLDSPIVVPATHSFWYTVSSCFPSGCM